MTINQSRAHLRDPGEGLPPDEDPVILRSIATAWKEINDEKEAIRRADSRSGSGAPFWASDGGGCARALGYKVRRRLDPDVDEGPSDPPTPADIYRMSLGSMVHDSMVPAVARAYAERGELEVKIIREEDPRISMRADLLLTEPDKRTLVELKTINGTGYKRSIGVARKGEPAGGPRFNAIIQGAMAAAEADADELVVLVLTLELVGAAIAERNHLDDLGKMGAQWTFTRDEYMPLVEREHKRMRAVLKIVEEGGLPPRSISDPELPHGNRIVNPAKGEWQVIDPDTDRMLNLGTTWYCDYCWDRSRCLRDGES